MEAMNAMLERRSIRQYKEDAIPEEILSEILKAGTYAANGRGLQSAIILAVTNREMRDRLAEINARFIDASAAGTDPFYGAPVVLVVLAKKSVSTHVYDGSLVMGNLMLAAWDKGIGSCWIHRAKETFETEEGKDILRSLGLDPEEYEGVGNCILGYQDGPARPVRPRKEDFVYYVK